MSALVHHPGASLVYHHIHCWYAVVSTLVHCCVCHCIYCCTVKVANYILSVMLPLILKRRFL